MQATGRNAVESVKESAADVAASARAGLEKTKAGLQEKVDKMRAHSDADMEVAEVRKEVRVAATELNKQLAIEQNAVQTAAKTTHIATTGGVGKHDSGSAKGGPGYTAGPSQMSALPAHPSTDIDPSPKLINN